MDNKSYELRLYCHYADLRKVISLLYEHTDGFVEYDFSVNRLPESPLELLNEHVCTFTGTPGQISEKYQVISFPSCCLKKVFDLISGLSNTTADDPLDAYIIVYDDATVTYLVSL